MCVYGFSYEIHILKTKQTKRNILDCNIEPKMTGVLIIHMIYLICVMYYAV